MTFISFFNTKTASTASRLPPFAGVSVNQFCSRKVIRRAASLPRLVAAMQAVAAMQTVAGGGKKTWVDILCDNLCELGSLELKILLKCRVVSREWRGALVAPCPCSVWSPSPLVSLARVRSEHSVWLLGGICAWLAWRYAGS